MMALSLVAASGLTFLGALVGVLFAGRGWESLDERQTWRGRLLLSGGLVWAFLCIGIGAWFIHNLVRYGAWLP